MPTRGCGERVQGGLYLTIPRGWYGYPIWHSVTDPPAPWEGGNVRAPMLIPDKDDVKGHNHVLLGIGKEFYPTVPDFLHEANEMGVSKRIPRKFDLSLLTPGKSQLLLMHPKAVPISIKQPWMVTQENDPDHFWTCPYRWCYFMGPDGRVECAFHKEKVHAQGVGCLGLTWPLSALEEHGPQHTVNWEGYGAASVKTPSVEYRLRVPPGWFVKALRPTAPKYSPGIILQFPAFTLEFVNRHGTLPDDLKKRAADTGWEVGVCPE